MYQQEHIPAVSISFDNRGKMTIEYGHHREIIQLPTFTSTISGIRKKINGYKKAASDKLIDTLIPTGYFRAISKNRKVIRNRKFILKKQRIPRKDNIAELPYYELSTK